VPEINSVIDVVVVLDPQSGATQVFFESPTAGANNASELWWDAKSPNYFLFHSNEFYDNGLRQRRNANLMYSPIDPTHRLFFVGLVWGAPTYGKGSIEIARTRLRSAGGVQNVAQ
jgi:hypothetical protein